MIATILSGRSALRPLLACLLAAACWAGDEGSRTSGAGAGATDRPALTPDGDATVVTALDELIAAERAFSATSVKHGMRDAFLANFASDVVTFTPAPEVGTADLEAGPPGPHLEWWPEVAEVSAAGDLGYTTGPYRVPAPDGREAGDAWGHYHSVWGRTADGGWHVLLDVGGPHGPVPIPISVRTPTDPMAENADGATWDPSLESLLARDRMFADAVAADPDRGLREHALSRARFYRMGQVPIEGVDASVADRRERRERLTSKPIGGGTAESGDLGYTWGTGTVRSTDTGGHPRATSYARVWRRTERGWFVVLEVVLPHAPEGAGG